MMEQAKMRFLREAGDPGYWDAVRRSERFRAIGETPKRDRDAIEEAFKNALLVGAGMVFMFLLLGVWR